jgi:PEGA domain
MSFAPGTRSSLGNKVPLQRVLRHVLVALVCYLGLAAPARAQPMGEVVVVPFGSPDLTSALGATATLEGELSDARVSLIPLHDARDRFTARSRPPQTASESDLDVLARAAHDAIEHVAFGRTAAAQKSVREVISRAERTLESLNRETANARRILDACLSLVRSALQGGKRDLALEQATRCRRLVPDLMPSEDAHPANVVGVLAEADNLLRRMRIGHLVVRSAPESGCSVYLNGRHLGTTPFRLDRAAAGDYRVQVECNRTLARVHVVQLGDQPASLLVDTQFDRAVASDPRLLLRYPSAREAREQAVSHAIQLGREIGASDVILVGVQEGRAELLRVHVDQQRLVARATVPWREQHGFPRAAIDAAISVLAEARLEGEPSLEQNTSQVPDTSEGPAPLPPEPTVVEPEPEAAADAPAPAADQEAPEVKAEPAAEPAPAPQQQRRRRWAGYGLLAAATGLTAVGVGYDLRAQNLNNRLSSVSIDSDLSMDPSVAGDVRDQQSKFDRARSLRWIGLAGPIVATAAVVLLVEPRARVPWWGYLLAGAGVGLAAPGVFEISRSNKCKLGDDTQGCRREYDSAAHGALLVTAALPLISVPLVQFLRKTSLQSYALSTDARAGRFVIMLHGRY